jgi:hypothetical protein
VIKFTGQRKDVNSNPDDDENEPDSYLWRLRCNTDVTDWNIAISNGESYDVHWFKDSESTRVETKHKNMWTYYQSGTSSSAKTVSVNVAGSIDFDLTLGQYDLVLYNVQTSDSGKYYCKAISRGNQNNVTLGSTNLTVSGREFT